MVVRAALLFLLCSANLLAEEFQVVGEVRTEIVSPFQLVAESGGGTFSFYRWTGSKGLVLVDEDNQCRVSGPAGNHWVSLKRETVFWNKDKDPPLWKDTDIIRKDFIIAGSSQTPDKPDEPDNPIENPGFLEDLKNTSREGAAKLQDPKTASDLGQSLINWLKNADPTWSLDSLKKQVRDGIVGDILLRRQNNKDWYGEWRIPLDRLLDNKINDGQTYLAAIRAIAEGLLESANQSSSVAGLTIEMLSNPLCGPCQEWKRNVMPALQSLGFEVSIRDVKLGSTTLPQFRINVKGRKMVHKGYLSLHSFNYYLMEMSR